MATIPLIGGSFDALNAQRMGWENMNRGIVENNIARQAAAQENVNRWLAGVAQMRQQAMDRDLSMQLSADQVGRQQAWNERMAASDAQRFTQDQALRRELSKENIAADDRRVKAQQEAQANALKLKREQMAEDLDRTGIANASSLAAKQSRVKAASTALEKLDSSIEQKESEISTENAKKRPNIIITGQLSREVEALRKQRTSLERERSSAETDYTSFASRVYNQGFEIDESGGFITHPTDKNKKWTFAGALKAAKEAVAGGGNPMNPLLVGPEMSMAAASVWPGSRSAAAAAPPWPAQEEAPVIPAPTTFKVGRFNVTAQ